MNTLSKPTYLVEVGDEVLTVAIGSGDQLRAELEQQRLNLPAKAAMHLTTLWIWAALVRMGLEDRKAAAFIADPPEWDVLKDESGEAVLTPVDPTRAALSAIDSSSPTTTVNPATG